ncbi:MAG: exosortase A [Alphaproteobacteria bacterium]|nr:MAG: exosortase A [Alphaproteobacteria bacterium]
MSSGQREHATRAAVLSPQWKWALGLFVLILAFVIGLHFDALSSMVTVWLGSRTYNHGFLIPPIVLWLVWQRHETLLREVPRPAFSGLLWLGAAAVLAQLGHLAQANTVEHFALVLMLVGAVVTSFGWRVARRLAFPLFYLFFMVPFGDFAIEPMQELTARATTFFVRASGVPIYLENWVMVIPGGSFLVAEACSGVRFLIATIALGVLMSHLFFTRSWKRALFVILSVLVPIGANVVRTYGIVMIAYFSDFTIAVGVDHIVYGFIFLSIVLLILIGIAYAMRDPEAVEPAGGPAAPEAGPGAPAGARVPFVAFGALLVLLAVAGYGAHLDRPLPVPAVTLRAPVVDGGWRLAETDPPGWKGQYPGADAERTWAIGKDGRQLRAFVAYYAHERPGHELISHRNSLLDSNTHQALRKGRLGGWKSSTIPVPAFLVLHGVEGPRTVWYWYWVDGTVTSDRRRAKLVALGAKLAGRHPAAALVAVMGEGEPRETGLLEDLLAHSSLGRALASGDLAPLVMPVPKELDGKGFS